MERATSYTREPIQFTFHVMLETPLAHFFYKCVVTNATNYDIFVGHQKLYPLVLV
jgi:hypothetical protein